MNDFSEFDLQLIVYSKRGYAVTNVLTDIRQLISKTCNLDVKFIKDQDVLMQVAVSTHKFGITESDIRERYLEVWKDIKITMVDQIQLLLDVIHYKTSGDCPKLPTPDPKYLPVQRQDVFDQIHPYRLLD